MEVAKHSMIRRPMPCSPTETTGIFESLDSGDRHLSHLSNDSNIIWLHRQVSFHEVVKKRISYISYYQRDWFPFIFGEGVVLLRRTSRGGHRRSAGVRVGANLERGGARTGRGGVEARPRRGEAAAEQP